MKKLPILGFYGYWVILTYLSVVSAITGVFFAFNGKIKEAMICLLISGICDMFDGTVARTAKRTDMEKNFGLQIDSLADIISFAVLPISIGYSLFINNYDSSLFRTFFTVTVMSIYGLAALIRLAYFNVTEEEFNKKKTKREYYEGLPVTNAGFAIPTIYSICLCLNFQIHEIYNVVLILIAIAFVSKIHIPKVKMSHRIPVIVVGIIIIIYGFFLRGI